MNTPTVTAGVVRLPAPPACVADVEITSGWTCHIDWDGSNYNVLVTGPEPGDGIELRAWESMEAVYESLETFFDSRGLRHRWVVLRAMIEAEQR